MRVYEFGDTGKPVILLLPGTCCQWKGNFGKVIPLLQERFHVACVSYDGFDETERMEFPSMLEETEKIEQWIQTDLGGQIRAAYGCSLGGSFVGLLAARRKIHMDYGILGSSDLDQMGRLPAKCMTKLMVPLLYPLIHTGAFSNPLLRKRMERRMAETGAYGTAFLEMLGEKRSFITRKSVENQFYSDLVTPLPENIDPPGTEIHILYALKMGEKYRARYQTYFAHPVLHELDLQHEELLALYPRQWTELMEQICLTDTEQR